MTETTRAQTVAAVLYGLPFVWVGIQHFVNAAAFVPIVPPYLGWPEFWVHITGWTEIGVGIGIRVPRTRRLCATLMMAQLARGGRNTAQIPLPLKARWFPDPVHQL